VTGVHPSHGVRGRHPRSPAGEVHWGRSGGSGSVGPGASRLHLAGRSARARARRSLGNTSQPTSQTARSVWRGWRHSRCMETTSSPIHALEQERRETSWGRTRHPSIRRHRLSGRGSSPVCRPPRPGG
jgi:hypothetical protein